MTGKQRKHFASILGICSVLTLIGGCQKNIETRGGMSGNTAQNTEENTTRVQTEQTESFLDLNETSTPQQLQVSINNKCIGCGHCTKIAKDTFSMTGKKAQVISKENIDSMSVSQAIAHCPVQAISIIKT